MIKLLKSLVSQTDFSFPRYRYLHIFMNVEKLYVTNMYVMILLIYYILFVFSTKTSIFNNYSYQKYIQETKNNSSFSKHLCLKSVCLSLRFVNSIQVILAVSFKITHTKYRYITVCVHCKQKKKKRKRKKKNTFSLERKKIALCLDTSK